MLSGIFKKDSEVKRSSASENFGGSLPNRPKSILKRKHQKVRFLLPEKDMPRSAPIDTTQMDHDSDFLSSSFDRITNIASKVQRDLDSVQLRLNSASQRFTDSESDGDSSFNGSTESLQKKREHTESEEIFKLSMSEDSLAPLVGPAKVSPRYQSIAGSKEHHEIQMALSTSIFDSSSLEAVAEPAAASTQTELSEQVAQTTQIDLGGINSSYFISPKVDAATQTSGPGLTRSISANALLFSTDLGQKPAIAGSVLAKDKISNKMGDSFIQGTTTEGTQVREGAGMEVIATDSDSSDDFSDLPLSKAVSPPKAESVPRARVKPMFSAEAMRRVGAALARQQMPLEYKDCGSK